MKGFGIWFIGFLVGVIGAVAMYETKFMYRLKCYAIIFWGLMKLWALTAWDKIKGMYYKAKDKIKDWVAKW